MTALEQLKMNLLEDQFPYFTDTQLQALLDEFDGDIKKASYKGCIMKAQNDSIKLGPIDIANNEKFWLRQAQLYKPVRTTGLQRTDE